MISNSKR